MGPQEAKEQMDAFLRCRNHKNQDVKPQECYWKSWKWKGQLWTINENEESWTIFNEAKNDGSRPKKTQRAL